MWKLIVPVIIAVIGVKMIFGSVGELDITFKPRPDEGQILKGAI